MRLSAFVPVTLVIVAIAPSSLAAQPVPPPVIHRITLQAETGVLAIAGSGLGGDLVVALDGQPVTVLPGATDVQMKVQAPAAVLTAPGTYRLTVVDLARQVGDGFVVVIPAGPVLAASGSLAEASGGDGTAAPVSHDGARAAPTGTASAANRDGVSPTLIEGPSNTAVGQFALANNTTGVSNVASGYGALFSNTTGSSNTASGYAALNSNTTASGNTATGYYALAFNTLGLSNTASGFGALYSNTTGSDNTASGYAALNSNTLGSGNTATGSYALALTTTGNSNTASGGRALYSNTTGNLNTATGYYTLRANTTGSINTASGWAALQLNTTGYQNTATGGAALANNTTGKYNTATGYSALLSNTTGDSNTAHGLEALDVNTTGNANTAIGASALFGATTGHSNTAVGNKAGANVSTGSHSIFLGADVYGTATDANTMRLGLPYDSATGAGQNRTFIAGIRGTQLTDSAVQVFIDLNGQLGTLTPPPITGSGTAVPFANPQPDAALRKELQEQRALVAELLDRVARLDDANADLRARLARLEAANVRRR